MRTIEGLITERTWLIHEDDSSYIDCFLIPQWFYDTVIQRQEEVIE